MTFMKLMLHISIHYSDEASQGIYCEQITKLQLNGLLMSFSFLINSATPSQWISSKTS